MTCAQGLLHLLWGGGGPKLECYGTVCALKQLGLRTVIGSQNYRTDMLKKLHTSDLATIQIKNFDPTT